MAFFSEKDFKELMIPIYDKDLSKNASIKRMFPRIIAADIPLLIYVSLMYDQKSPLKQKIANITERKKEAVAIAGIKATKDELSDIFDLNNDKLVEYINIYLRSQSSKIWAAMVANEEVLWQYQQELLTPITVYKNDKDKLQALEIKSKLMQECDSIIKRIDAYEEKLFGDTKDKLEKIVAFTPESIANIN